MTRPEVVTWGGTPRALLILASACVLLWVVAGAVVVAEPFGVDLGSGEQVFLLLLGVLNIAICVVLLWSSSRRRTRADQDGLHHRDLSAARSFDRRWSEIADVGTDAGPGKGRVVVTTTDGAQHPLVTLGPSDVPQLVEVWRRHADR